MAQVRIAMLISDHGWGHLNRSLVLAEELARRGHPLLLAVAPDMASAVRAAVPSAEIVTGALDRGYAFGARGEGTDRERSRDLLRFARDVDPGVSTAVHAWQPNLVVADATPWASTVAEQCGVPSVICTNFSWDDQYEALFEGDDTASAAVEAIHVQVAAFTVALELPLGPGVRAAAVRRPVPMLGRRPSAAALSVPLDRPLVAWAFGRTVAADQPLAVLRALQPLAEARGLRIVANEEVARAAGGEITAVPDDTPWADLLAASRIVITKAGYSTVTEALRGSGHVIALGITGLPEERAMLAAVEARGFGLAVPLGTPDVVKAVLGAVAELLARPERTPEADRAEGEIADALEEIARPEQ